MKKIVIVLLAASSLSFAWSQDFCVGGGISLFGGVIDLFGGFDGPSVVLEPPLPSVQVGGRVATDLDFRVTLESNFSGTFIIGTDFLYVLPLEDPAFLYIGGGVDVFIMPIFGTLVFPSLHPTVGVEFRLEPLGIFAEVQPQPIALVFGGFIIELRTGINSHF